LIENGANINKKGDRGMTALSRSVINENFEICKLLIDRGASVIASNMYSNPLRYTNSIQIAKLLLDAGADMNFVEDDKTILFETLASERDEVALYLLSRGAISDNITLISLLLLSSPFNNEMSVILMKYGAKVNIQEYENYIEPELLYWQGLITKNIDTMMQCMSMNYFDNLMDDVCYDVYKYLDK
jgi:ankyrin repeat protein